MSRFRDQQCVTRNGQDLTFKTRSGSKQLQAAIAALPGLIDQSKSAINAALLALEKPLMTDTLAAARTYFLLPGQPTITERVQMRKVLTSTLTGLSGDMTLKVGDLGGNTMGSVTSRMTSVQSKPYHNFRPRMELGSQHWRAGAVHLDSASLAGDGELALCLVIHEATHKYAGTRDYCYFEGPQHERQDNLGGFSRATALSNADSHSWFAVRCLQASQRWWKFW